MIDSRLRNVALLVAGCFFMEILDGTIVVTAIPRMSSALHATPSATALVITAFLLTLAALIPVSGWLTARFGARRVFLAAIAIFTAASLGCALSRTLPELVLLRVLQGAGGAMMVPVGRLLVLGPVPKSQLLQLMSYIVWPGLIAPVIAPLAGGIITTYASWRWMFVINVPLGLLAFALAWRLVHTEHGEGPPPRLDRWGVVLTCTALGGLAYTGQLLAAPSPRWDLIAALGPVSAALLAAATWHLLRTEAPLINLRTLRIPTFGRAMGGSSLFWLVVGAIPFLLPLLFQTVWGWSPIKSGAVVLFIFVGNIAIKPATTALYTRFGFRTVLVIATAGLAATAVIGGLLTASTPLVVVAVVALLSGVARSVGLTGYSTLSLTDVPPDQMRDANSLQATIQQLFSGLGVAAATIALRVGSLLPGHPSDRTVYAVAFALLALIALMSLVEVLRLHPSAGEAALVVRGGQPGAATGGAGR
jgi:EmrB/QacA subfamily drug resistance transporter